MRRIAVSCLLVSCLAAACSSSGESAGFDASLDATAGSPDAHPTEIVQVSGNPAAPASCDAVCGAATYTCAVACDGQAGKVAGFKVYEDDQQTGFSNQEIATCGEAVSSTYDDFGITYSLYQETCCCAAPAVTRIDGPTAAPIACDAVCQQHGLRCHEQTDWGFYGTGGALLEYKTATEDTYFTDHCNVAPGVTWVNEAGSSVPLTKYTCGCL